MPTPHRPAATYARFLKLIDSMAERSSLPALDSLEQRIIHIVALAWYEEARLSVNDMQNMSELGCYETVRRHLKSLREIGWIALADTSDARRKQVVLTEAALLVLDALGSRLLEAVEQRNLVPC